MMDNEYSVDVAEIMQVIRTSDVLLVRFPLFDKRLLLDVRCNDATGPMVKVVPRATSAAERFQHSEAAAAGVSPAQKHCDLYLAQVRG